MSKSRRKSGKSGKPNKKKLLPAKSSSQVTAKPKNKTKPVSIQVASSPSRSTTTNRAVPKSRKLLRYATLGLLALLVIGGAVLAFDKTTRDFAWAGIRNTFKGVFWWEDSGTYAKLPINDVEPPGEAPSGMVWIPGGWFWMGTEDKNHQYASPVHKVYVDGFWLDKYEVTNKQFKKFVDDTGYKTIAEKKPIPKYFPDLPPSEVRKYPPFSLQFTPPPRLNRMGLKDHTQWWKMQKGASWKHPEGPGSDIKDRMNHPVVHICWLDAVEYCNWRSRKEGRKPAYYKVDNVDEYAFDVKADGYRLPTEAEWEFAALGGNHRSKFIWGDELKPDGKWCGNVWQGRFPMQNTREDGYITSAPVGSYPPNEYGLYDMAGNVWEWCHDYYMKRYYEDCERENSDGVKNPLGPVMGFDPAEPGVPKRVQRGGSFLCHASYCERYLTYARGKGEISSAANHIGFRCALPVPEVSSD